MIRNYLYGILILTLFVTLKSCSGSTETLSPEEEDISELLLEKFSADEILIYEEDTLLASDEVLTYYEDNAYAPIWIGRNDLNPNGDSLLKLIGEAYDYGFLPEMFHHNTILKMKDSSLLDAEMILSNAFFLYSTHIYAGCIDTSDFSYTWKKDSLNFSLEEELDKVREGENVKQVILAHEPDFWDYKQLQTGLAAFLDSFDLDTAHFEIPAFKEDSLACYKAANEALIAHHFLDSTNYDNDSIFIDQLKKFQLVNGLLDDGIVGKWTSRALAKSNTDRFLQAALGLEKWRWKSAYPDRYIRVNIPEFTLYFVNQDTVKRKHRVVVGAYKTQTPEFHATMERMVTNPFWHVPYSISSTEILYGARKDSAYLQKKGYKLFKNGEQVDPSTVNWSELRQGNFPYRVRQDGGGGNSLGRVKFLFPNIHSVFIHDTPSKRLFGNDVRAYSHGCVRLDQPFDLAKSILTVERHEVNADTLDSLVHRGTQRVIELEKPFEVYIEYITATGDSSGTIRFHPDIYFRDEKYLKDSFGKFDF